MSPATHGEPNMTLAESCQYDALQDLQIASVAALTSVISASLAALHIYPDATVLATVISGIASLPFILNGVENIILAHRHRDGISVPG